MCFSSHSLVSLAQSGVIDELPVVVIENRTNQLPVDSPFYNKSFPKAQIIFYYQEPNGPLMKWGSGEISSVDPGMIDEFPIVWPLSNIKPSPEATIYWSYQGGVIDEFPIIAFPYGTKEVATEPTSAPLLELGKAKYPLADPRPTPSFWFASPGTLVGGATFFTTGTQSPCDPKASWKNHGQFVRCVAQEADALVELGVLTQDEADAVVSSAAQSEVGK